MSEPTKDPTAAGSPGAAGSAIQWLDWHSGRPHANPTASSLVAGHYCTGNPEAGWVLYSRGGSCWHARTQPERPPLPGMVPARTPEEEWSRDMTFRLRMMELLKTNSDRAAQDVAWMDSIRAEVEAGKL